ncbi:D-alanyl-D-alanine carboxypeptidase [Acidaminobacter sp. JC074]|uniref:D-alanyl-D-alanine carboxypeptidase family protein n=1 Tax=Acidaminobacter sp. JC074 TaxID=2530199 RepID=UPI001F11733B|nr:D-alanyl-D-alanine carboxypeptidase family protein [Acidaminobacter sp. JC074]MCH4886681.1 D-alanyl-D-alanine carboxypeptidase [Acidaminobacter sp. JC074]
MKKLIIFLCIMLLVLQNFAVAETLDSGQIVGESAILIDELTGQVLFEKDPDKKMYPASTTKILTALIILENHALDEVVTIDDKSPFIDGKRIYVIKDEKLTVEQLLYATLVESANDAAYALAVYHSGSVEAFCEVMNQRAKQVGAVNSNFTNPNGLHDNDHYSTARDLALIAQNAMQNETLRQMVQTKSYTIPETEKQDERNYLRNTNAFLGAKSNNKMNYKGERISIEYDIVDGIKTGYTPEAGNCLVSSAKIGNQRFISVVLRSNGDNSLYVDSRTLLDYGFENFVRHTFVSDGAFIQTVQLEGAGNITVNLVAQDNLTMMLNKTIDLSQIERLVYIDSDIKAPIAENQILGKVTYNYNNIELASTPIISEYAVSGDSLLAESEFSLIKKDENDAVDMGYYMGILFKLLISFIIYRAIITTYNLRKRKKRLQL